MLLQRPLLAGKRSHVYLFMLITWIICYSFEMLKPKNWRQLLQLMLAVVLDVVIDASRAG